MPDDGEGAEGGGLPGGVASTGLCRCSGSAGRRGSCSSPPCRSTTGTRRRPRWVRRTRRSRGTERRRTGGCRSSTPRSTHGASGVSGGGGGGGVPCRVSPEVSRKFVRVSPWVCGKTPAAARSVPAGHLQGCAGSATRTGRVDAHRGVTVRTAHEPAGGRTRARMSGAVHMGVPGRVALRAPGAQGKCAFGGLTQRIRRH